MQQTVDDKGDKEEEGGDEDEDRVKLLSLLSVVQLLFCQFRSTDTENRSYGVFTGQVGEFVAGIGEVNTKLPNAVVGCVVFCLHLEMKCYQIDAS